MSHKLPSIASCIPLFRGKGRGKSLAAAAYAASKAERPATGLNEFGETIGHHWTGHKRHQHSDSTYGYGSIPINTFFSGMNIHLPAILMFTRGTRVLTHCHISNLWVVLSNNFSKKWRQMVISLREKWKIHWQEWGVSPTAILSDTENCIRDMVSLVSPNRGYISRPGWSSRTKRSDFGGLLGSLMVGSS